MEKKVKVKWLKEKSGHKPGDIVELEENLANQLIRKEDVELLVPVEMEVSKSGEKGIEELDVKNVKNVIDVKNVKNVKDSNFDILDTWTTYPETVLEISDSDAINKIIKVVVKHKNADLKFLSEVLGKQKDTIDKQIRRNLEYFVQNKPDGKVLSISLSKIGIEKIEEKIARYLEEKRLEEERVLLEKEVTDKREKLMQEFKNYYNLMKKDGEFFDKRNRRINLDFMKIAELDLFLADELENNPEETLRLFELTLEETGLMDGTKVRVFNLPKERKISIEKIRADHLEKLVSVCGRVVTLSDVRPQVVSAKFECPSCGTIISVLQMEKKFREPTRCSCGRRGGFKVVEKTTVDTARLILEDLQEKTDNPHTKRLNFFLKEDLLKHEDMKLYESGTEVEIVGVLKEVPVTLATGGLSVRLELAVEVSSVSRAEEEISLENLTEEEEEEILELANKIDKEGLGILTDSFAPEIYGQQDIKKALCLQLASKKNEVGREIKINKPNILLIGDPGTSKSKLGEFAVHITPGARRSVGGSASAVGLTGAVVRDDYTGGWRLEPGAAVLARDFYMIDELNNVKDEDKPRLQELLSEHTITFDKATIHAKLKALSGVLATANPIHGLFKQNEDLVKQFNLSPPIINRFDLIFVMRDAVDEKTDELIAKRMNQREMNKLSVEYDADFLKKFFVYVKEQPNPLITDEMDKIISKIYVNLRKYKTSTLNINPRVHIAFLQLCKASAKIRLSEKVEEKDIILALDLLNKSYFRTPSYRDLGSEILKPTTEKVQRLE